MKNVEGDTPLHLAIPHSAQFDSNSVILTALINAGASINAKDKQGYSPLQLAILYKSHLAIKTLLTTITPTDIQHIIPGLIAVKRGLGHDVSKDLEKNIINQLFNDIINKKIALVKQYLPDEPEAKLRTELKKQIIQALRNSPPLQPAGPDTSKTGWLEWLKDIISVIE